MKKILVLSYYFQPDLSAGSFRNSSLVAELSKQLGENGIIHVITTQPNRYSTFKDKALFHETYDNVIIDRIEVPEHKSGFRDQIFSYIRFYRRVLNIIGKNKYDLIYASSSRLFTAYLGKVIATRFHVPLYLDIRDIFVETMVDVLKKIPVFKPLILKLIIQFVEKPTFRRANHINLVSEGFKDYFTNSSNCKFTYYPNGIDDVFMNIEQADNLPSMPKIITYAGNIGEGQGLEKILPEAAKLIGDDFIFQVIGDGGTRGLLEKAIEKEGINNIKLVNPVKRNELLEIYKHSHYLFLHLNNYKAFERVLPSKIFEYGAFNMPIVAGIPGYSRSFAEKNLSNCFVFDPCDYLALANWLKTHHYRLEKRSEFINNFSRTSINKKLALSILSYL